MNFQYLLNLTQALTFLLGQLKMTKASTYQICSIISQIKTSWNLMHKQKTKVILQGVFVLEAVNLDSSSVMMSQSRIQIISRKDSIPSQIHSKILSF